MEGCYQKDRSVSDKFGIIKPFLATSILEVGQCAFMKVTT